MLSIASDATIRCSSSVLQLPLIMRRSESMCRYNQGSVQKIDTDLCGSVQKIDADVLFRTETCHGPAADP